LLPLHFPFCNMFLDKNVCHVNVLLREGDVQVSLTSSLGVLPKDLPFCYVPPLSIFQHQLVFLFIYDPYIIFGKLLSPSSLDCT
jgi:hypothetical protein